MSRRPVVAVALIAAAVVSAVPAHAAAKKPKPITGTYNLTLYPDVTVDVIGQVPGKSPVCGTLPQSKDSHPFTVPGAGKLVVDLTSPDPTPSASPIHADWDLYILDSNGQVINGSHSAFATEHTEDKFKVKTPVTFLVCNVSGETSGTVKYAFTYA